MAKGVDPESDVGAGGALEVEVGAGVERVTGGGVDVTVVVGVAAVTVGVVLTVVVVVCVTSGAALSDPRAIRPAQQQSTTMTSTTTPTSADAALGFFI